MTAVVAARGTAIPRGRPVSTATVVLRMHGVGAGDGSEDREGESG